MFFTTTPSPSPGPGPLPSGNLSLDTDLILLLVAVVIIAWALGQLSTIIFRSIRASRRRRFEDELRRRQEQDNGDNFDA